jgi:septum formation protein
MLILASTSPRRKEILDFFSVPYKQVSPDFDEDSVPFGGDPKAIVMTISKGKAESLIKKYPKDIILAADTLVYFEGEVLGKPKSEQDAIEMLQKLQGKWHSVFTGITVINPNHQICDVEESRVLMKDCSLSEIKKYIEGVHCLDKAGSYTIQGKGNLIIEKNEGCFYNTCGLPINALERSLKVLGLSLWNFLKQN